jgi:hypothetical protein
VNPTDMWAVKWMQQQIKKEILFQEIGFEAM